MTKTRCTDATVAIVDKESDGGDEVSRWECSACRSAGNWTPTRERNLIAIRGHAHTLRSRGRRPRKGAGRVARTNEFPALRKSINLGGF